MEPLDFTRTAMDKVTAARAVSSEASLETGSTQSLDHDALFSTGRATSEATSPLTTQSPPVHERAKLAHDASNLLSKDFLTLSDKDEDKGKDHDENPVVESRDTSSASPKLVQSDLPLDDKGQFILPSNKRKRPHIDYSLDRAAALYKFRDDGSVAEKPKKKVDIRGVLVGLWRDSPEVDSNNKHVVFGFIDNQDRLRTRIHAMNRHGDEHQAGMPGGVGGVWVTPDRIIFDEHLKPLSSAQIKEYVKLRGSIPLELNVEDLHASNARLVTRAKQIVAALEAKGAILTPKSRKSGIKRANVINDPEQPSATRRSGEFSPLINDTSTSSTPTAKPSSGADKPNDIVIGYWLDSDSATEADKHAVVGLISDTAKHFRVKVLNITRDGRPASGNFPTGLGACWLHYEKVVLEPHLANMSRMEVKEYVRARMRQTMAGEDAKARKSNEAKAVREAKSIIAAEMGAPTAKLTPERHSTRVEQRKQEFNARNTARSQRDLAALEIKSPERRKKAVPTAAQATLDHDMKRLNRVWAAKNSTSAMQKTAAHPVTSMPAPLEHDTNLDETIYHHGIKYERKKTGPFEGKLSSAPQILNIDGEDYIEYRVLTKPSFF